MRAKACLRFGHFIFDGESRELKGPKGTVHLSPKAFDLLGALLENRPRALSKAEVRDRLWPKTNVTDSSLARAVNEIRKTLRDPASRPVFVRTVHGFGYAFCGDAVELARPSLGVSCHLDCGPREFPLSDGENVLGRASDAAAWLDSPTVSRRHARVVLSADGATIEDLGSKNGTYLRGRRLDGPAPLVDGDVILVGSIQMTFRRLSVAISTKTDVSPRREA